MKFRFKIIYFLFLSLFFCAPLIFTQSNSELFELPKMYFVYLVTILIAFTHLINVLNKNVPLIKKNILNIFLLLFFLSQLISTFFSIDSHTSIFGYYSRLNGGLLSLISYIVLFLILNVYIDRKFFQKIINFSLLSAFLVSAFAIAEHFGIDKNWWVQDVQSRVFSTFGQPNWLAAYLCIIIPFSVYKFLDSKIFNNKILFLFLTSIFYISLLFTKSKSGIIACLISLAIYFVINFFQNKSSRKSLILATSLIIIFSLLINNPLKDQIFPPKQISTPTINNQQSKILITSSGNIRKIVWKGAIDLWKKFPIFGTGPETFAFSYYWTRPAEHNLTSEWDFLYNKAHNEYLNYLATTGILGFITYLSLITAVLFILIKRILKNKHPILDTTLLSSFISILITNFAGFSVVVVSLFFFLIPTFINIPNEIEIKPDTKLKVKQYILLPIIIVFTFIFLKNTISFYLADIMYARSSTYEDKNDYQYALSLIQLSTNLNPSEPIYLDKLSDILAKLAVSTKDQQYIDQSISASDKAVKISPANISFWKQRAQNYLYFSTINSTYYQESINSLLKASKLAPTDAKIFYTIGQFLETASLTDQSIPYYQQAITLKSNYDYAYFALGQIYLAKKEYKLAKENLQKTVDYSYPTNTEAEKLLEKL